MLHCDKEILIFDRSVQFVRFMLEFRQIKKSKTNVFEVKFSLKEQTKKKIT